MDNKAAAIAAIHAGDTNKLGALLAEDQSLASATDNKGVSAIMIALYHRKPELLKLLLAAKPDLNIFEAASTGRTERVAELLNGDPVLLGQFSPDGFTALHFACFFAQEAVANLLLQKGAAVSAVARNAMKVMPLHSAATARNLPIVRALLEHGAPPNARQQGNWTPLHAAAQSGDRAMVELLLEHGADRAAVNDDGVTSADLARKNGNTELAQLLT